MGTENICEFVRSILQDDDSLSGVGNCRDAVSKIGSEIKRKFPGVSIDFLVWPEPRKGDGVHYSLIVDNSGKKTLINTVAAPGFPEYIGDPDSAALTFSAMKPTSKVI